MRFPHIPNKLSLFVLTSALAFSALLPGSVSSEIIRWKGSVDERFSNAANWEPSRLPSLKDNVIFNGDAKRGCKLESNGSVASIQFTRIFKYRFSFNRYTLTMRGPVSDFSGLKTAKNANGTLQFSSTDSAQTVVLSPTGSYRLQSLIIDNKSGVTCVASVNRVRSGTIAMESPLDAAFETLKLKRGGLHIDPLPSGAAITFRSVDATPAFRVITTQDTLFLKSGSFLSTRDLPAGPLLIESYKPLSPDTSVLKAGPVSPAIRTVAPAVAAATRTSGTPEKPDSTKTGVNTPNRAGSTRATRTADPPSDSIAGVSKVLLPSLGDTLAKPPSDTTRTRTRSTRIDLGGVRPGSSIDTVLSFANNGPDTMRVSNTSLQRRSLTVAHDTILIPPGDTAYDSVRFSPTVLSRDSIVFVARTPTARDTIAVYGYGKAAWCTISPDTIRARIFGESPTRALFKRKNMGTDTLRMKEITCLSDSSAFSESILVVSNLRPVPPGDTSIDTIVFYHSKSHSDTVTIVLRSNTIGPFDTLVLIAGAGQPATAVRPSTPNKPRDFSFTGVLMGNRKVLFSFTLSAFCRVRLEICNAIGQAVQLPVNGFMDAGVHELSWEAPAYAKGVYFCRFKATDAIDGNVMFGKTVRVIF